MRPTPFRTELRRSDRKHSIIRNIWSGSLSRTESKKSAAVRLRVLGRLKKLCFPTAWKRSDTVLTRQHCLPIGKTGITARCISASIWSPRTILFRMHIPCGKVRLRSAALRSRGAQALFLFRCPIRSGISVHQRSICVHPSRGLRSRTALK